MVAALFDSAQKVCRWAETEISEFEATYVAFFRENPPQLTQTVCAKTGANVVYPNDFMLPPALLDRLERGAYRIVGDLRNVLDQACHAACISIGSTDENRTNFPVAEDDIDFDKRITNPKGVFRGIPAQLHRKLKELAPFWHYRDGGEGNTKLRTICQIANPNKHKVTLAVGFTSQGVGIISMRHINMSINPEHRMTEDRPEVHWTIAGPDHVLKLRFDTKLHLSDAGIFTLRDATSAFREMHAITSKVVDDLALETRMILESRS